MERLQQYIKKVYEKIKALSMKWKIILGAAIAFLLVTIIILSTYGSSTKYGVLFSGLSAVDGKNVTDMLTTQKVSFKVDGNTISVPSDQVGLLRLQLAPSLTNGSVGYELFNTTPTLGETDAQFNITKLRATQGELERTIKSFPQVENARVHLALPQESAFVTDNTPGSVSVYLTLKQGMTLDKSQVKAIIALISGSLDNVPRANVNIIDDHLDLISADANSTDDSSIPVDSQQALETKFEGKLEEAVKELLEPVFGANKVKVQVNANMNFDSKERTTITYDPQKSVLLSRHFIANGSLGNMQVGNLSPVDNNMTNYAITTSSAVTTAGGVSQIDSTENYNNSSTTEKVLNAPGEITRITASVLYDGNKLSAADTALIQSAVENAIGYDPNRSDQVTVGAMPFDPAAKAADLAEINALKAQTAQAARMQQYKIIGAIVVVSLVVFGVLMYVLLGALRKRRAEKNIGNGLDVTVGEEPLFNQDIIPHVPLDFSSDNEADLIEQDIKRYAEQKPDQVADIIKSWLAEDER